jgi:DNA-directed RNA polymerase sigma subunit (sigma70/sigma32)
MPSCPLTTENSPRRGSNRRTGMNQRHTIASSYGDASELHDRLSAIADSMKPKSRSVVRFYFGLDSGKSASVAETARRFGVPRGRVRQALDQAMRQLVPDRPKPRRLAGFLDPRSAH